MREGEFYWCLRHQRVEPPGRCRALDRLGPYASLEEACRFAERAEARNERWEREDERWTGKPRDRW